jgi:hypothetical protein
VQRPEFRVILEVLARHQVDFVVVGGVAAVLQGAPVSTFDLDIVHSRDEANLGRLTRALQELDAYYRERPELRRLPDYERLRGGGHHLLITRAGPLDVLGTVVTGDTYDQLAAHSANVDLGDGLSVLVLDLAQIINIKERLGRDRDRAALPILKRALQERQRGASRPTTG